MAARFITMHARAPRAIVRWQERRLRMLVVNAARHIPMYRSLLDESGTMATDIVSLGDLVKLPLMSKSSFLGRPVEEYINGSRSIRSGWRATSGTSGRPFSVLSSDAVTNPYFHEFCSYRFLWRYGRPTRDLRELRVARIKIRSRQRRNRMFISVRDYLTSPEEVIAELAAFKPDIIESYSSILLDIARWSVQRGRPLGFVPTHIVSFGEMLTPAARSLITRVFSAEIFDRYATEETGTIAVECPRHTGMHINSESVIVEIVDANGRILPEGASGRVVVTDLFNLNMPFIRYDTGDCGTLYSYPACPCGLRTPRLTIEGRYSSYLRFGTRRIHHLEFDGALDAFVNHIEQYQVVKVSENALEVRIIPAAAFAEGSRRRVLDNVSRLVGEDLLVSVVLVTRLEPTERGKSRIILDLTA